MSDSSLIPFGKYKGQPTEILAADPQYMEWLTSQGWVRERFPQLYTLIINNFGETADTPEHNALQARFLDESLCIQVAHMVWDCFHLESIPADYINCEFEPEGGGDILIRYREWMKLSNGYWVKVQGPFIVLELKPSMGDDFPGILRSIKRLKTGAYSGARLKCVCIYNAYTGTGASIHDVQRMFASSSVLLASLDDLQSYPTIFSAQPSTHEE